MDKDSDQLRDFFKRWPKFYYFVNIVFGPLLFIGLSSKKFLKIYSGRGHVFNLGSGPLVLGKNIINIDLCQFKNVHVVSDISKLPLKDNSAGKIICDNVLEHIPTPEAVIKEIYRVLLPGALSYLTIPFLYPYHPSPCDFTRWTKLGFLNILKGF